ncbi:alpha/beta fold hydrolase [Methylobacter luteus]|uniref:alpha/beta fold hydrolase n=1 Tax=Methylobacter luteus TaxID=415 RepID=UPI00041EB409|nr:alpha/beta hydrolase [Methylobacter luteus]
MNKHLGRNWILLRGLSRESAHWGDFVPLLQAAFPEARITALDLPGTGRYYREASPNTISQITHKVRAQAQQAGLLQQSVTVLGLSLGAMVAFEWMLTYPGDICGATLINTSFAGLSPFYRRLRWQSLGWLPSLVLKRNLHERESAILALVSNRNRDEQIVRAWEKIQQERPVSFKNSWRQIRAAASYRPCDRRPEQSVLLLNARGDRLVAPECSVDIYRKWHWHYRSHPWAGHDLTLDDGAWVASQLREWVAQN